MKAIELKFERMERIEDECKLAEFFNLVMDHLERSRWFTAPIDFHTEIQKTGEPQRVFYESCLWELYLHNVVLKLKDWKEAVNEYLNEYKGSWEYYAHAKRLSNIKEYGGEDSDYDRNGEIRTQGLTKEDLMPYSLSSWLEDSSRNAATSAYPKHLEPMFLFIASSVRHDPLEILQKVSGKKLKQYKQDENGNMVEVSFPEMVQRKAMNEVNADAMVKVLVAVAFEFRSLVNFRNNMPDFEDYKEELTEFVNRIDKLMNMDLNMPEKARKFYERVMKTNEIASNQ